MFVARIAAIFCFLFLSVQAKALTKKINEQDVVDRVAKSFYQVMGSCPDLIWPNYSWKDLDIVLARKAAKDQTVVSVRDGKSRQVPSNQFPQEALETSFSFFELGGRQMMSLSVTEAAETSSDLSQAADEVYALGIHEAFHFLVQATWKESDAIRGTEYPISHEPRLVRRLLFDRLKSAFLDPKKRDAYLGYASFWFEKWKANYPYELKTTTDGYEGTARYADAVAKILQSKGCGAKKSEFDHLLAATVQTELGSSVSGTELALDAEGYEIGSLAAFILQYQMGHTSWMAEIASGKTPVEVLLSGVTAVLDNSIDPKLRKQFETSGIKAQKEAEALVGESVQRTNDPSAVIIALPQNWFNGSYSPLGFFVDSKNERAYIPLEDALTLKSPSGTGTLDSKPKAVILDSQGPCASRWNFILLKSDLTEKSVAGQLTLAISSPFLKGTVAGNYQYDSASKLAWFCAM